MALQNHLSLVQFSPCSDKVLMLIIDKAGLVMNKLDTWLFSY